MPKYMYIAYFEWEEESSVYNVSFPDLAGCVTFGKDVAAAINMARDALEGYLLVLEDDKDDIPKASAYHEFRHNINEQDFIQYIEADTDAARKREDQKTVNKMVTLPNYLVQLGKANNINFSALLQKALKNELNIK
ncbi:type II toxin-antitoxin system HicB family antitoxin [Lysinibacillus sp. FSL L8-0312]|uniref:type II toxin-antitoxin system HicB family antitoxin n=1 Tax=unclassified Lysinibacillus TaxID=2636778 RepID=UPI00232B9A27|nr:type II toxin-antitoxin system HicB family antitoxin [Lysinibacillus sp. OF-1]WCH49681.1 type II toxin-antitoxin system HicB family antitoxin [Lysinibacillus sp. OF-1]